MKKIIPILLLTWLINIQASALPLIGKDIFWDSAPKLTRALPQLPDAPIDFLELDKKTDPDKPKISDQPIAHLPLQTPPKAGKGSTKKLKPVGRRLFCPLNGCTHHCISGITFYEHLHQQHSPEDRSQILYMCHEHRYAINQRGGKSAHLRTYHKKKKREGKFQECPLPGCTTSFLKGNKFYTHLHTYHSPEDRDQILYMCHKHKYAAHNRNNKNAHVCRMHPKK